MFLTYLHSIWFAFSIQIQQTYFRCNWIRTDNDIWETIMMASLTLILVMFTVYVFVFCPSSKKWKKWKKWKIWGPLHHQRFERFERFEGPHAIKEMKKKKMEKMKKWKIWRFPHPQRNERIERIEGPCTHKELKELKELWVVLQGPVCRTGKGPRTGPDCNRFKRTNGPGPLNFIEKDRKRPRS